MPKNWMTLRLTIVALSCLAICEACGSNPAPGVSSATATPNQVTVISPSQAPPTPTRSLIGPFPTTPTGPTPTSQPFTPIPTVQPDSWENRWLKGVPCKPPCWENIVPGKTTVTEAKKLLEDSGLASDIITKVVDLKATRGQMRWNWNGTVGLGGKVADGGIIYYSNTGSQTIDIISPSLYASYSFGDVIKAYGEPEYILALGQYSYPEATVPLYSLSAVYLTKGFMINEINTGNKPANLNPNTLFAFDMFFIPS